MSKTRIVNIRRENCDVYIGRAGHGKDGYFGNPFRLEAGMVRGSTLDNYRKYFYHRLSIDEEFRNRIEKLQDKTLGCFCKPNPCHGDIIKEYLDRIAENTNTINIGKLYWKRHAYPVREIYINDNAYRISVKRLENKLLDDIRNGIYEAMKVSEEIDFYCTDEELCTLSDTELYEMYNRCITM